MEMLALGKWSKADKKWKMVVAMRRPETSTRPESSTRPERRWSFFRRPDSRPENR